MLEPLLLEEKDFHFLREEYPDPDVKLSFVYQKRSLYVFLNYECVMSYYHRFSCVFSC